MLSVSDLPQTSQWTRATHHAVRRRTALARRARARRARTNSTARSGAAAWASSIKARDRRLKRTVAIKLLPPELAFRSEIRSRFLREAETAAQLTHPNIVPIYSVDEKDGLVYFVMAFIDGDNLAKRIHDQGALRSGRGAAHPARSRRRARLRARARGRAPRHQAGQHPARRAERPADGDRLRHRARDQRRRRARA